MKGSRLMRESKVTERQIQFYAQLLHCPFTFHHPLLVISFMSSLSSSFFSLTAAALYAIIIVRIFCRYQGRLSEKIVGG